MKFVGTLNDHLRAPHESVEMYVRRKRLALANDFRTATKIYLDTKFWLLLRDARLGRSTDSSLRQLLVNLETLAAQKRALCPISVDTFAEVFKQTVPATLRATAQLIDDLSLGLSLIEPHERLQLELFHFVREKTKGVSAVHRLDDLVWTKTAYVLGFVTPRFPAMTEEISAAIQRAFVDQMWEVTLVDMLDQMSGEPDQAHKPWFPESTAEALNEGKFSHMHEYSSFKQLFLNELAGVLDLHKPLFADLMRHVYEADTGKAADWSEGETTDGGRLMANLIYHAFRLNKISAELPSLRIGAGLHAAVRWDPKRKYKVNDLHDFHHAIAAIPYCDWFFTEHGLRHLVDDKNLRLSSHFRCRTVSNVVAALHATAGLLS